MKVKCALPMGISILSYCVGVSHSAGEDGVFGLKILVSVVRFRPWPPTSLDSEPQYVSFCQSVLRSTENHRDSTSSPSSDDALFSSTHATKSPSIVQGIAQVARHGGVPGPRVVVPKIRNPRHELVSSTSRCSRH